MAMRGPDILARTMSVATTRGSSDRPWQYHSRSDNHSKVACWTVLFDLMRECDVFRQHVTALSDPFMEGRGPGTRGNQTAAEYIEFYFKSFGLEPAFTGSGRADEAEGDAGEAGASSEKSDALSAKLAGRASERLRPNALEEPSHAASIRGRRIIERWRRAPSTTRRSSTHSTPTRVRRPD